MLRDKGVLGSFRMGGLGAGTVGDEGSAGGRDDGARSMVGWGFVGSGDGGAEDDEIADDAGVHVVEAGLVAVEDAEFGG